MTQIQLNAIEALSKCTFLPGSIDKRFATMLKNKNSDADLSEVALERLILNIRKYRRQIPEWQKLHSDLKKEAETPRIIIEQPCDAK